MVNDGVFGMSAMMYMAITNEFKAQAAITAWYAGFQAFLAANAVEGPKKAIMLHNQPINQQQL